MKSLPSGPVTASEWAYAAWDGRAGGALTVPTDALQELLDAYVANAGAKHALERRIKVTVEADGVNVPEEREIEQ